MKSLGAKFYCTHLLFQGSSVDFTLLARINLYMEVYLTKLDGTELPAFTATDSVGRWLGWLGFGLVDRGVEKTSLS